MIAVIPMAGRGSRYSNRGYEMPKPLIDVAGKPMVTRALKSLQGMTISRFVFVVLREHEERYGIRKLISQTTPENVEFVLLEDITEGQLCTVLAAREFLNKEEDVLIASSDTFVENALGHTIKTSQFDGIISVANLPGDHWSFAKTNERGEVIEVAEKKRISDHASTGLYYFRKAGDLIDFGDQMIEREEKTRGEYYVIPVYQKMIEAGYSIGISQALAMWDMGTPEAKAGFEKYLNSHE
jgi:dTDP-glucose pyrophosphorylase